MADKHLRKDRSVPQSNDAFDAFRSLHFKTDNRTNAEKVQDSVVEAGHETRSVNQVVKLVNMSINEKVKRLQQLKQESKRFDDELNMFTSSTNEQQPPQPQQTATAQPAPVQNVQASQNTDASDVYAISSNLLSLINRYGLPKFSVALNGVLSDIKASEGKA
ncbi:MAG: hypothetical protein HZC29_01025 [Thaumarchaeota archaeon]|nr:hypothetical protein [Nitrososphaerota archaeon]